MCTYLTKRGATYYFRRVVPDDLRQLLGRKEWMHSLGTKDRKDGEHKSRLEAVRIDAVIVAARAKLASAADRATPQSRSVAPSVWHSEAEFNDFIERTEIDQLEEQSHSAREQQREALRARLGGSPAALSEGDLALRDLLAEKQLEADLARERLAANNVAAALMQEPASSASVVALRPAKAVTSLASMVALWAAEKQPDAKTVDRMTAVTEWFEARLGAKAITEITPDDVLAFKDKLLAETTQANAKTKLSNLRTLLNYAKGRRVIQQNPAADIFVVVKAKPGQQRKEFDLASLEAVFSSPVYTSGTRPDAGAGEAAYWLPLLALYTGARLNELGQLRSSDIVWTTYQDAEGGNQQTWVIKVVADPDDGLKVKNLGSERSIPVHRDLIGLGFIEYVQRMKTELRIFPQLKPDKKYGTITANWSKWFNRYLRVTCGVSDTRLVFHSFRHSFKHYARQREIPKEVQDAITGHQSKEVADKYGPNYPLSPMVTAMGRYMVPGFKLPARPPGLTKA